jgi:hypothetical protein
MSEVNIKTAKQEISNDLQPTDFAKARMAGFGSVKPDTVKRIQLRWWQVLLIIFLLLLVIVGLYAWYMAQHCNRTMHCGLPA